MAFEPVEPRPDRRSGGRHRRARGLACGASLVALTLLGACGGRGAPGPLIPGGQLAAGLAALERIEPPGAALRLAALPGPAPPPQADSRAPPPAARSAPWAPPLPAPRKPTPAPPLAWLPELKPGPSRAAAPAAGAMPAVWPAPLKPGVALLVAGAPPPVWPAPRKPHDVDLAAIAPAAGPPDDQAHLPEPDAITVARDRAGRPWPAAAIAVAEPDLALRQLDRAAREALLAGDATTALHLYQRLSERFPSERGPLLGRALALQQLGRDAEAEALYQLMLDTDAGDLGARIALLGVLAERAPDEALRLLRRLARHHPQDARLPAQSALVLAGQGALDAALAEQRRAVALAPDHPGHQVNLAVLLDRAGQQGAAALAYRRALELATLSGAPGAQLGQIAARLAHLHALQGSRPVPAQAPRSP
jgi:Flp pilus assembly protein TadD